MTAQDGRDDPAAAQHQDGPTAADYTIDTSRPHPARVYDWLLGGRSNHPADEELARRMVAIDPRVVSSVRLNRAFMHRAVRWAVGNGVHQFLDLGTGIPTEPNLHQIAQRAEPASRVVYADNDPIVLAHAATLLRSSPEGVTEYLQADVREPGPILSQAREFLDFSQPVALSLLACLHFVPDEDGAHELVARYREALAPGSLLVLSHGTGDFAPEGAERARDHYGEGGIRLALRSRAEILRFFAGTELVDPGLVSDPASWRPELGEPSGTEKVAEHGYVGVARKL
ncbi:SAM-dependent methyltransferase [Streptomyces xiaopingdaonensis]|uniref:SAM-dependent methyltransferase n=1 Tax=Streptomyces xiaopingdaonensis TaxID=1565415 RepID=UPI0002EC2C0E|nr:SAM-dependent methyltransferase [Streptomyces xiaopingdaonensis]